MKRLHCWPTPLLARISQLSRVLDSCSTLPDFSCGDVSRMPDLSGDMLGQVAGVAGAFGDIRRYSSGRLPIFPRGS